MCIFVRMQIVCVCVCACACVWVRAREGAFVCVSVCVWWVHAEERVFQEYKLWVRRTAHTRAQGDSINWSRMKGCDVADV